MTLNSSSAQMTGIELLLLITEERKLMSVFISVIGEPTGRLRPELDTLVFLFRQFIDQLVGIHTTTRRRR